MGLPVYLAMTEAEIRTEVLPSCPIAYMACHFSPYLDALSGIPESLPPGAALMLNDRIPIRGHSSSRICDQLAASVQALGCNVLLLDFQTPDVEALSRLCQLLLQELPCQVVVSHHYARQLSCPVLLPPVPPHITPEAHIAPWEGRRLWVETVCESSLIHVDASGSRVSSLPFFLPQEGNHYHDKLCCSYDTELTDDAAKFRLTRGSRELSALLSRLEGMGVSAVIGLYQQLFPLKETAS